MLVSFELLTFLVIFEQKTHNKTVGWIFVIKVFFQVVCEFIEKGLLRWIKILLLLRLVENLVLLAVRTAIDLVLVILRNLWRTLTSFTCIEGTDFLIWIYHLVNFFFSKGAASYHGFFISESGISASFFRYFLVSIWFCDGCWLKIEFLFKWFGRFLKMWLNLVFKF